MIELGELREIAAAVFLPDLFMYYTHTIAIIVSATTLLFCPTALCYVAFKCGTTAGAN